MGVSLDRRSYWFGINYDKPELLEFSTDYCEVDKDTAAQLGIEGVYPWEKGSSYAWHRVLDLQSEEVHFFARSKASQMQLLETFLKECLATVKQIEIRSPNGSAGGAIEIVDSERPTPPMAQ